MGRYAEIGDVQDYIPASILQISSTSWPDALTVEQWIGEVEERVDGLLSSRYVTPVTASRSIGVLKGIVARLVAARTLDVLFSQQEVTVDTRAQRLREEAEEELTEIYTGKRPLPDALALSQPQAASPGPPGGATQVEPLFRKEDKF